MYKYKSPAVPPFLPASPSPATRIRVPSSTPAGIFTDNDFSLLITPVPEQCLQGLAIILPVPLHVLQVLSIVKKPWLLLTFPLPPQVVQV